MLRRIVFGLVAAALLAGCSSGKTYQVAPDKARDILLQTKPPMSVLEGFVSKSMVTQPSDDKVKWTLLSDQGKILMHFVATIQDGGEGKSVISVEALPPNGNEKSEAGRMMSEHPAVVDLMTAAMQEQIGSRLEHRTFDMTSLQPLMLKAAFSEMPKMQQNAAEAERHFDKMAQDARTDAEQTEIQREEHARAMGEDPDSYSD
jgi:hypothetical protein